MAMSQGIFLVALLLAGGCASRSAEWEFRQFTELTKADLEKIKGAVAKPKATAKLSGGRTAQCEQSIGVVPWSKPILTLYRKGAEGKAAKNGRGTFTLDQVETAEMLATMATAQ